MSVDHADFEAKCRALIRRHVGDLLRGRGQVERDAFIDEEAASLAYALAEVAETRLADLRAEVRA